MTRAAAIPTVALLLALTAAAPGCPPRPVADTAGSRRAEPLGKDVIRVRIPSELPQMPCLLRNHTWCDRILVDTVYEPLVRYDVAQKRYVGVLATSWKYLDGGRTFQMELRRKVLWHNGQELTSRDVKHSLGRLRDQTTFSAHPAARLLRRHVERLSYPTDHLFEIKFNKPFGPILEVLSALPIVPSAKTLGKPTEQRTQVVGTGPYRFLQWWQGEKIVFSRNPKYWGNPGALYRLEFHVIRSLETVQKRLLDGKLDLVVDLSASQYQELLSKLGDKAKPFSVEPAEFAYLALNVSRAPLSDARVRRAVSHLIDRKKLVSAMPGGKPRHLEQPVWILGPQSRASMGTGLTYSPDEASKLLAAAGWAKRSSSTYLHKEGRPLTITLTTATRFTAFNRGLRAIQRDFERAGVRLQVHKVLWGQLVVALKQRNYDAIALSTPLYGPWSDLVDLFHSRSTQGGGNHAGFRLDAMDKLLERMIHEIQPAKRMATERRIYELASQQAPLIPLYAPRTLGISRKPLGSVVPTALWLDLRRVSPK